MDLAFLAIKECRKAVEGMKAVVPFKPYLHGPFSKEVLDVLERLRDNDYIAVEKEVFDVMWHRYNYSLTSKGWEAVRDIEDTCIKHLVTKYAKMPLEKLLKYIYKTYPDESTPALDEIYAQIREIAQLD